MNTQYNFLDNAVNDESELTRAKDMDTKMCSYPQNDTEDVCPTSQDATCGDGILVVEETLILLFTVLYSILKG